MKRVELILLQFFGTSCANENLSTRSFSWFLFKLRHQFIPHRFLFLHIFLSIAVIISDNGPLSTLLPRANSYAHIPYPSLVIFSLTSTTILMSFFWFQYQTKTPPSLFFWLVDIFRFISTFRKVFVSLGACSLLTITQPSKLLNFQIIVFLIVILDSTFWTLICLCVLVISIFKFYWHFHLLL